MSKKTLTLDTPKYDNWKIIYRRSEIRQLIRNCKKTGYCCFDFETNAEEITSPHFYPTVLGISFQPGSSYIIPLGHKDSPIRSKYMKIMRWISQEIFENLDIVKVNWNSKFEYQILKRLGLNIKGRVFDGMLAKYLLDEERPNGLKDMVTKFIPEFSGYELKGTPSNKAPKEKHIQFWSNVELNELSQYCGLDCDLNLRLMIFFENQLMNQGFYPLFRNMMMMATRVLGDSEFAGFPIDKPYLKTLLVKYEKLIIESDLKLRNHPKIKKFEKWLTTMKAQKIIDKISTEINEIYDELDKTKDQKKINSLNKKIESREEKIDRLLAHEFNTVSEKKCLEPINFGSPAQMADLFFNSKKGFRFPIVKYTTDKFKNPTDNPSTDESVLIELAKIDKSGFCQELLNYRGLTTLNGTFVRGMYDRLGLDKKVHGRFLIHGTVTGRLSSQDPNLQNIPRVTTNPDIKRMFVPPKGYLLLQLDYSQAELRVMAAAAGETEMIRWFKEGKDIHLASAMKKYHIPDDQYATIMGYIKAEDDSDNCITWTKRRKQAKTINFGIIYGQGANKLMDSLGCSLEEAKQFLVDFKKTFPKVDAYVKKMHRYANEHGYVRNLFGRKRRLANSLDSGNKAKEAEALRQSVNAPIQGAASDYALFSSILIWERSFWRNGLKLEDLKKKDVYKKIHDEFLIPIDLPQVYTVHDSLGFFVKPQYIHDIVPELLKICSNPETKDWFGFQIDDVTMKVDFEVSHENWGSLKSYNPETDYTKLVN